MVWHGWTSNWPCSLHVFSRLILFNPALHAHRLSVNHRPRAPISALSRLDRMLACQIWNFQQFGNGFQQQVAASTGYLDPWTCPHRRSPGRSSLHQSVDADLGAELSKHADLAFVPVPPTLTDLLVLVY